MRCSGIWRGEWRSGETVSMISFMPHFISSSLKCTYVNVRELKHSTDVRTVFLNNKIMVTTDDLKDIYLWDLELPSGDSSDSSYQRQRNTCIRSLTGLPLFLETFLRNLITTPRSQWASSQCSLRERRPLELRHFWGCY